MRAVLALGLRQLCWAMVSPWSGGLIAASRSSGCSVGVDLE